MSQLALQSAGGEPRPDPRRALPSAASVSSLPSSPPSVSASSAQDSPTIGRTHSRPHDAASAPFPLDSPTYPQGSRAHRRPPPSPLHNSTPILSPLGASPSQLNSPFDPRAPPGGALPQIVTSSPRSPRFQRDNLNASEQSYYHSESSRSTTPDEEKAPGPVPPARQANDTRSASDPVLTTRPAAASTAASAMAGSSRVEAAKAVPRTSSIDSAMSSVSAGSHSHKSSQESGSSPADIEKLVKAAGSPQAVIQYLLKEKHSQSQQNAQLWRLVDKQRAMILGLNKDLERALKDKEKYRKKLKEVVAQEALSIPRITTTASIDSDEPTRAAPQSEDAARPRERVLEVPASPALDLDSHKLSPVDVSLAPYPITPPADHLVHAPASAVGEILDPLHAMPKASEHALDRYDHEAQEREAEAARKESDADRDLPINIGLPPSRSLPGQPPRVPPPEVPSGAPRPAPSELPSGAGEVPPSQPVPPLAPPPRKPPPAPLQLRDVRPSPAMPPDEDLDTESDYDDILEVDEIVLTENRGRRKTREEDEEAREIIARHEAEMRSLSKKSKKSSSAKRVPEDGAAETAASELPASPRAMPLVMSPRDRVPASLAGMLSADAAGLRVPAPLMSPGLPSSPRPMNLKSPVNSPPLSPRSVPPAPLSPRPPRQPIPLPLNTPLYPPPNDDAEGLAFPKPLTAAQRAMDSTSTPSPTVESPTERTRVYRGLMTDEYPDLILPPNALPHVAIRVASSRMKPSRASLMSLTQLEEDPVFTLAVFSRADGGELWRAEKDITSLAKLDSRLKQCPAFTARTPDRSLFTGHAPAKLDARRIALDQYLDEVMNTPLDQTTAMELCKYLSSNTLPPNADETGTAPDSVQEHARLMGAGSRPFRSGYLTKRGKNFGGWKARFFVLEGPHLKYFETPGGAHLGTIKLQNAQIGKQSHQNENNNSQSPGRGQSSTDDADNQYRHAFLILEPKKKDSSALVKHVLCAESDRERDQWVDALLRWIDYRDPDDEDPKDGTRPGSGHERNAKKKAHAHAHASGKAQHQPHHHHQPRDSGDTLVSISYDTAKQGDTPSASSASSGRPRTAGGDHDAQPSSFAISAPKDPMVISDSASWGNKIGVLAPPTADEKKARKRSFFGFGTKTRTSSDGQDSLFGDSGSGSSTVYSGPIRQVFGAPLAEAVRYNSPTDVSVPLPAVVYRCIQFLDAKNATHEEGIFRLSGSNVVIKQLRERFNQQSDVDLVADSQYHDIHTVASLLKLYLRELPTTILTRDLHLEFLAVTELQDPQEKIAALNALVQRLPQANATLLKYLISFLIKIINHAEFNKMTVRNVGIVFSPTLNIPAPVFAMLLQNYYGIFGIEPEAYELPSLDDEDDGSRPSNDSVPLRPPTSGNRESPQRQRLMEAIHEGQRSTPTPPPGAINPLQSIQQMRGTPTPPPAARQTYEPQYLAQQGAGLQMPPRSAYEGGYMPPQGFDPSPAQAPPSSRAAPGYDRPLYETANLAPSAYDQGYSTKANRRESAMFMGGSMGLSQQSSRSRLREETHY